KILLQFQTSGVVSDGKVNILGALKRSKVNIFQQFSKKSRKTKKKSDGKTGIFTQNQITTKSIFLYGYSSKTNHCKYLKFSPNIYISTIENFDFSDNSFFEFIFLRNMLKNSTLNFSKNIPSNSYRENSKHHNKKNVIRSLNIDNNSSKS
ncbi:Uncharacterized protein FWK35_00013977, partial [Aphis craccivora]